MCSFIKVLIYTKKTLSGRLRELGNKGKVPFGNPKKLSQSVLVYESFSLQSSRHSSNLVSQTRSLQELAAYESGRNESCDYICVILAKLVWSRSLLLLFIYFLPFYGPRLSRGQKKTKKRTRPICSHLDRTSLVNKVFIIWPKRGL